ALRRGAAGGRVLHLRCRGRRTGQRGPARPRHAGVAVENGHDASLTWRGRRRDRSVTASIASAGARECGVHTACTPRKSRVSVVDSTRRWTCETRTGSRFAPWQGGLLGRAGGSAISRRWNAFAGIRGNPGRDCRDQAFRSTPSVVAPGGPRVVPRLRPRTARALPPRVPPLQG